MAEFDGVNTWFSDDEETFGLAETITLDPITLIELTGGIHSFPLTYDGTPLSLPPIKTTIQREFPVVWRFVTTSGESQSHVVVRYQIRSEDDEPGRMSSSQSEISIPVNLQIAPQQSADRTEDIEVLQGGCILELDIGSIRRAGTYRGKLHVDIFKE